MSFPSDFIPSLTYLAPAAALARLLSIPRDSSKGILIWKNEVAPADLYCYLTARFGMPNGPHNAFRANDSDNFIHWDWVLEHPSGVVHFMGMNFRTEFWVAGDFAFTDSDRIEVAKWLKADFKNYGTQMAEVRKSFEKWTEFVNPYQRIRVAIDQLLNDIAALDLQPDAHKIPDPGSADDDYSSQWSQAIQTYSKGLGLCFGVRSMLPVMAEAFVNFVLFVLMRPELKNDERLRENTLRQPIDVRVKSLHVTCIGFAKQIDYASSECKAYHTLVNERNDLLHGNVVIEKLRFNEVYFKGTVPLFHEYRSMWERSLGVMIDAVGLNRLANEVETVTSFIRYLTTCMEPEVERQFAVLAAAHNLGWNAQTGRVGILFSERLVDVHMATRKAEATAPSASDA
jgi:hypothetical protein